MSEQSGEGYSSEWSTEWEESNSSAEVTDEEPEDE